MIQIERILITYDPLVPEFKLHGPTIAPELEVPEITIDEIREFGENFFSEGVTLDVCLTDGSSYSFVRDAVSWEWVKYIDYGINVILGEPDTANTLEEALDQLLTKVNEHLSNH